MKHDDPRLAGRVLEGKLVFAVVCLIAIGVGVGVVTEFILPAFAQIGEAFNTVGKN